MQDTEYLIFKQVLFTGLTKKYDVISKGSNFILGRISWYPSWRQYTFSPAYPTVWNNVCLESIKETLEELNRDHNEKPFVKDEPVELKPGTYRCAVELASEHKWVQDGTCHFSDISKGYIFDVKFKVVRLGVDGYVFITREDLIK